MRLIDADAIVYTHAIARSIDDGHNWNELCVTKDEIDDMPSAEPERKKGTWIYDTERIMHDGWTYNQYHCSLCNCQVIGGLQNYCPYCGADMRGK